MATLARLLYDLQNLDQAIAEAGRNINSIQARLGEPEELKATRQSLTDKEREHKDIATRLLSLELDLAELGAKIAANETTLYAGSGQSPKELASLDKEVEFLKNRRSEVEEKTLEIMGRLEETEREEARLRQEYARLNANWQEDEARLREELQALEEQQGTLLAKRKAMVAPIAAETLAIYEELRQRKGGQGVALVKEGICSGCGVDVPRSQQQEILRRQDLIHCLNCERILYMPVYS